MNHQTDLADALAHVEQFAVAAPPPTLESVQDDLVELRHRFEKLERYLHMFHRGAPRKVVMDAVALLGELSFQLEDTEQRNRCKDLARLLGAFYPLEEI